MTSANEPELIEVMTINDGPAYTEELSEFVKNGDYNKLRKYLDNTPATILNSFNEEGRSPLHDACDCGTNKKLASKLVSLILLWYSRHKKYDGDDVNKNIFIDKKDGLGNTALHYAVEHRNREAVKELLACGADVNIKNDNEEEAITSIYEHFPETIISLLNGPTSIQFVEDEDDPSDRRMKVKCNFGVITGIDNDPREVYETNMLSNVFRLDKETRVEILLNPIVQLFIDLKWSKMKKLIYISMAFHIIWSLLSSIFIMDMFMKTFGNNTKETFEALENSKGNPYFNSDNEYRIWTLFIYTAIVMVKEGFEIWFTPKYGTYGTQFENIGQWILIIFIYVLFLLGKFLPVWSGFLMSIVSVFIAWVLVLGQLNKHPELGLYMEMLMKVSKRFMYFFISFCPILIAFSCVFRMIMPSEEQFYVIPPSGIAKIAAMLTGEIGFDDIIKEKEVLVVKVVTYITLLAFITIVVIALQNLLVGLVVSDMQSLAEKARENSLSTLLEQMFLMEAFINRFLTLFHIGCRIEEMWMVTRNQSASCSPFSAPLSNPDEPHIVVKHINEFSKESCLRLKALRKQRKAENDKNK
ncbi:unnamed protein product [Orchesella dallaii]|uniref:Ion transport domain-containing protein n=1 Tax=Orchesella dallaii TaxID=48710 RepID=A0ABP1RIY5_9HEXA